MDYDDRALEQYYILEQLGLSGEVQPLGSRLYFVNDTYPSITLSTQKLDGEKFRALIISTLYYFNNVLPLSRVG